MLKNYIKIALRNLYRNKIFSFINIVGLAIGLAVSFCIMIYVMQELSYDKHHENYDEIYRLDSHLIDNNWRFPFTNVALGERIYDELPEVNKFTRLINDWQTKVFRNGKEYKIKNTYFADTTVFEIFDCKFIYGNPHSACINPNSIVISKKTANMLFGKIDVLGESVNVQRNRNSFDYKITGIIEDEFLPSSFKPEIIIPFQKLFDYDKSLEMTKWENIQATMTFMLLDQNVNAELLADKITAINNRNTKDIEDYLINLEFNVVPLSETYFAYNRNAVPPYMPIISKDKIILYSVLAIIVLLLACINFILLSSAKSASRNIEMGVRKVIGARRLDIIKQVIFETCLTMVVTFPLTILFIELLFPFIQDMVNREVIAEFYLTPEFIIGFILLNFTLGVLSGSYIAFYLTKLNPTIVLKGSVTAPKRSSSLRRILLSAQMLVFSGLVIAALILKTQMNYIFEKDLGYDTENIVRVSCYQIKGKEEAFRNSIVNYSGIIDHAFTKNVLPLLDGTKLKISTEENPAEQTLMVCPNLGYEYFRFLKMELLEGEFPKESDQGKMIINESAKKILALEDPIGTNLKFFGKGSIEIVGVVKDFHVNTLRDKIKPVAARVSGSKAKLLLRLKVGKTFETMEYIKSKWSEISDEPIDYSFSNDDMNFLYNEELRFEKAINLFTGLAIVVSFLGLFGIVMFSAQQRTKEIGIRKVLGASVSNILKMLTKEFVVIVLTGTVIASPIAYYLMKKWLDNFAYKTEIGPEIFLSALFIVLSITLLTISIQAIKAAIANPVDSLRDE